MLKSTAIFACIPASLLFLQGKSGRTRSQCAGASHAHCGTGARESAAGVCLQRYSAEPAGHDHQADRAAGTTVSGVMDSPA
jgi:hypothetical protein